MCIRDRYNLIAKDEYFKKLIEESRGYEDRIVFTGYVFPEDMPAIYTLGDVLVIPSMWEEPFGVVALEGMAMKVPIIATNSGGLVEAVSYTHLRAHETRHDLVCRLLLEKKKNKRR